MTDKKQPSIDLASLMTFENQFKQFIKTFFIKRDADDKKEMTDEQMDTLKLIFWSGAAALNSIITSLRRMNISEDEKEEVLTKVLMEIELLFIDPNFMKKQ